MFEMQSTTKTIASMPPGHCLRKLHFPHRVPFTKEKMPWCPYSFKNEAYRLEAVTRGKQQGFVRFPRLKF